MFGSSSGASRTFNLESSCLKHVVWLCTMQGEGLYCEKMKQYCLKFLAVGERLCVNQLGCLHAMCSAISMGPCGMVQPITMTVLKTFTMMNKCTMACWLSFLQTLKEYEIITLIYNRKSCRLDLLSFWSPEDIIL